jgi:Putative Flp pilus-assembly TadE/G-like
MRGRRLYQLRKERERGQILVLFALFLTVLLALGSIVLDVGNWYVLHRHLQTQVDAAALAGGPAFTGCTQDEDLAKDAIELQALKYAGDPSRDALTDNLLMEDTVDVHAVLNSSTYWSQGDQPDGSENDWSLGMPCDTKFLDVKATDQDAPLLWGWIPFLPDLKTRAKVEISRVPITNGLRPLGVPEVDPVEVAVVFVNEDGNPLLADSVRGHSKLDPPTTPPTGPAGMSVWSKDNIAAAINGGENFSVIIVASRVPIALGAGMTLSQICNQNPTQTHCYGGGNLDSGISFIHAYSTQGTGGAGTPIIRDVTLDGGCVDDLSRPYFNLTGGCPIGISATIDFNTGAKDPSLPAAQGGVCATVSASGAGQLTWVGGAWTGSFTPAVESGANKIDLSWSTDTVGGCGPGGGQAGKASGVIEKVAKPFVSNDASGPVQYVTVEISGGGLANSMTKDSAASLDVTVGLASPLRSAALTDPPIVLRGWVTPSQSQALDCEPGASGWNNAMQNGCPDAYQIYDDAKHVTKCGPPPAGVPAADPKDCIESKNGNFQENPVEAMFSPCADYPNRWDGVNIPPPWDTRWMPLFVLDELAFAEPGKKTFPIRRFGMFYVTAVSGMNCPGDDPPTVPNGKREMWGHFITYVTPGFGDTIPSTEPCSFTDGGLCVSNLVE